MFCFNLNFEQMGMGFMVTLWMWHDDLSEWHLKYIPLFLLREKAWTLSRGPKSARKHLDYKNVIDIVRSSMVKSELRSEIFEFH